MTASELFFARLRQEEGERALPYDDANGLRVKAPIGNITWGLGFALEKCGSSRLFDVMARDLIAQCEEQLQAFAWYNQANDVRKSVFLDVAYNAGVPGLLHFVNMIHYASVGNWQCAADQLLDSDAARKLPKRYNALASLLVSG